MLRRVHSITELTPKLCQEAHQGLTYTAVRVNLRILTKRRRRSTNQKSTRASRIREEIKYHVVFFPKMRKKKIFEVLCQHLGAIFRELTEWKCWKGIWYQIMYIHVGAYCQSTRSQPWPDTSKDKNAITIARKYRGRAKNFTGETF